MNNQLKAWLLGKIILPALKAKLVHFKLFQLFDTNDTAASSLKYNII